MAARKEFRILVASDGSLAATAAVVTTSTWPWPAGTRAFGIVAEPLSVDGRSTLRTATTQAFEQVRAMLERTLENRWHGVRVWRYSGDPSATIVRQARRTDADLIVMGWRGHGVMRRLLVGSVSRGVVRHAGCSVLVVRHASRELRRVVLGYDRSANAARAIEYVARLVPAGSTITLVLAVHLMHAPARALMSAPAYGTIADEISAVNAKRMRDARRILEQAAKPLRKAGLNVEYVVSEKAPLDALLRACDATQADLLAVGATGATRLRGLLVGSVAQGALDRSSTPVLIVR